MRRNRISSFAVMATVVVSPAKADVTLNYAYARGYAGAPAVTRAIYVDEAGNYRRERTVNGKTIVEEMFLNGVLYEMREFWGRPAPMVMRQSDVSTATDEAYRVLIAGGLGSRFATMTADIVLPGEETIAGYRGKHYLIGVSWDGKPGFSRDLVLSSDAVFAPVIRAQMRMLAAKSSKDFAPGSQRYYALLAGGVVLREGETGRLDRVDTGRIDRARFDLPGPVVALDVVRTLITPDSFRAPAPPAPPKR